MRLRGKLGIEPMFLNTNMILLYRLQAPIETIAKQLYDMLAEREIVTFYDENEQHRILAKNVEEYLGPIYRSEARYVVPLLSPEYPSRIWTKFESDQFRERFGSNSVIPVRYTNVQPGFFSDDQKYGGLSFDPAKIRHNELCGIVETLSKRLIVDREEENSAEAD